MYISIYILYMYPHNFSVPEKENNYILLVLQISTNYTLLKKHFIQINCFSSNLKNILL